MYIHEIEHEAGGETMSRYRNKTARIFLNNLKELSVFRQRSNLFIHSESTNQIHRESRRIRLKTDAKGFAKYAV